MKTNIVRNLFAYAAITLAASSAWAEDIPVECAVKRALSIETNLWFDRSNDHLEGIGVAELK